MAIRCVVAASLLISMTACAQPTPSPTPTPSPIPVPPRAETLFSNPEPMPAFVHDRYGSWPSPQYDGEQPVENGHKEICISTFSHIPVETNLGQFDEIVKVELYLDDVIIDRPPDNKQIVDVFPGEIANCWWIDLYPGLHMATVTAKTASGKKSSYSWAFRITD